MDRPVRYVHGATERCVTFSRWDDREAVRTEHRGDGPAVRSTVTLAEAEAELRTLQQQPGWQLLTTSVRDADQRPSYRQARRHDARQQRRLNTWVALYERCTVQ